MPKPYTPNDKWAQRAQQEGFRARSVYKLMDLDKRYKILKKGMHVLDLGAAPGSWMQYTAQRVGSKGTVIGVDLQEIDPFTEENIHSYVEDITNIDAIRDILKKHQIEKVNIILSDLAPKTSGIRDVDQWRSIELSQAVVETAKHVLSPKGVCVIKVLRGADFDEFLRDCKKEWKEVKTARAEATRDRSNEVYVILKEVL